MERLITFIVALAIGLVLGALSACAPSTFLPFETRANAARDATAIIIGYSDSRDLRTAGTAFAVAPGYFATAWHVVDNTDLHYRIDGQRATVVFHDEANDTAVLSVPVTTDHTPLPVDCDRTWPEFATPLLTYGFNDGIRRNDNHRGMLLEAYVASDWRHANPTMGYNFTVGGTIVNPGASGGAWVDDTGRAVGIVSMTERFLNRGSFPPSAMATVVSYAAPVFALCTWLERQ